MKHKIVVIVAYWATIVHYGWGQSVCDSTAYTRLHPTLVTAGNNMIFNSGFETGSFDYWFDDAFGMGYWINPSNFTAPNPCLSIITGTPSGTVFTGTNAAVLNKSASTFLSDVDLQQYLPSLLPAPSSYTINARVRSITGSASVQFNLLYFDNRGKWGKQTLNIATFTQTTAWSLKTFSFSVPLPPGVTSAQFKMMNVRLQVMVSSGGIYLDDVQINSLGGEWSPITSSKPTPQPGFTENFTGTAGTQLDANRWLLPQKQWGGSNNGVVPENLELQCGNMRFHGHGSTYTGTTVGEDGSGKTLVGSAIATKEYYASGQYDVIAKVAPLGVVSAFWPYHYIEDATYNMHAGPVSPGFNYAGAWATIQNTEIDWEFPDNIGCKSSSSGGVTGANCNVWGSKCEGLPLTNSLGLSTDPGYYTNNINNYDPDKPGYSWREIITSVTGPDAFSAYHKYTIKWHAGRPAGAIAGMPEIKPSVEWLIDDISIRKETRPHYVPYRAARFWIGVWYPNTCWTGPNNHSDIYMDVKSISITPYADETNDRYESESDPFVGYTKITYPTYPVACTVTPVELTYFSGKCTNAITSLSWKTASESNNNYFTVENSEDGINFFPVGTVLGAGSSNRELAYQFSDRLQSGKYYRLKQTDFDGKTSTSDKISVTCVNDKIHVWKKDNEINIEINNNDTNNSCQIILITVTGQILYSYECDLNSGMNLLSIDDFYNQALYIVKIIKDGQLFTKKVGL